MKKKGSNLHVDHHACSKIGDCTDSVFSVEEEVRYPIGYEERYDFSDEKYHARLKVNHSDVLKTCPAVPKVQSSSSGDHDKFPLLAIHKQIILNLSRFSLGVTSIDVCDSYSPILGQSQRTCFP